MRLICRQKRYRLSPQRRVQVCRMRQTVREGGQSLAQIGKSLKLKGEIMGNEDLYIDGEDKAWLKSENH